MRHELEHHNVKVKGKHRTITLEPVFWDQFVEIAGNLHQTPDELAEELLEEGATNLASAVRTMVLCFHAPHLETAV